MPTPPDAGNPVRIINPFWKITGVGWATPADIWALLTFKCTFYSDGINDHGDEVTFNYERFERLGITPRYTKVAALGGGNTFLATSGSFALNEASCISDPAGFNSKYKRGPTFPFVNAFFDTTAAGVPGGGSLNVGEDIGDLTNFNAVWENGLQNHEESEPAQLVNQKNMVPFGTNYQLFRPDPINSGDAIFDLRMYSVVNIGKIIKDVGGLSKLSKVQIDIIAQRTSIDPPDIQGGALPLRTKQIDIKYYRGKNVKFRGAADRTIVADLSNGGSHISLLDETITFEWADCPVVGGVVHTFTYQTGNT